MLTYQNGLFLRSAEGNIRSNNPFGAFTITLATDLQ